MAEQESKYGKWIVDRYCSECEWDKQEADYTSGWREDYCPNCGAKMRKEHNMRFLVDKLPVYESECLFVEPRWDGKEEDWEFYCKLTQEMCKLDWDVYENGCIFLKEQDK